MSGTLVQRERGIAAREHPIGVESFLESAQAQSIAPVGSINLFVRVGGEKIRIAACNGAGLERGGQTARPLPMRGAVIPRDRVPRGDNPDHEVAAAQAKGGRGSSNPGAGPVEMLQSEYRGSR